MITIAVTVEYPLGDGLERDTLAFQLWSGYGCRTGAEAHEWILWLLDGPQPAEVLDEDGEIWQFWKETVRLVVTWRLAA